MSLNLTEALAIAAKQGETVFDIPRIPGSTTQDMAQLEILSLSPAEPDPIARTGLKLILNGRRLTDSLRVSFPPEDRPPLEASLLSFDQAREIVPQIAQICGAEDNTSVLAFNQGDDWRVLMVGCNPNGCLAVTLDTQARTLQQTLTVFRSGIHSWGLNIAFPQNIDQPPLLSWNSAFS